MSYSDTLETDTDRIRAYIGDTSNDPATEMVTDDHIDTVRGFSSTLSNAVAFLANELAVRYAQEPGRVTLPSGLTVAWQDRVKTWLDIAALARTGALIPQTGGVSFVPATFSDGSVVPDEYGRATIFNWWYPRW